jgi:hypothetical protein
LHKLWHHGKFHRAIAFLAENIRFLAEHPTAGLRSEFPPELKQMGTEESILLNQTLIPERDPLRKIIQGDFNLTGSHIIRSKRFNSPTALARRSFFYLQNMASINFPANHFTRRSGLDSYLMALTFLGEGHLEYEGKIYILKPGEGFIIDCMLPHYYNANSRAGWGYHIIHFSGFAMKDYFSQIRNGGGIKFTLGEKDRMYALLDRLYDVNIEEHYAEDISLHVHFIVKEFISRLPSPLKTKRRGYLPGLTSTVPITSVHPTELRVRGNLPEMAVLSSSRYTVISPEARPRN